MANAWTRSLGLDDVLIVRRITSGLHYGAPSGMRAPRSCRLEVGRQVMARVVPGHARRLSAWSSAMAGRSAEQHTGDQGNGSFRRLKAMEIRGRFPRCANTM